jgi:hypothetical protein
MRHSSIGRYDLSALKMREAMLDQLETEVDLMNRTFEQLAEYVERDGRPSLGAPESSDRQAEPR